jgi:DeoR family transcriptional regulator, suf operon transcriptional repressor
MPRELDNPDFQAYDSLVMAMPIAHLRASAALPVGYKGPRASILVELKFVPGLTAKELAARLGLSLNAIRHHLKELELDGLLAYEREQRGVGAPVFAYRLSPAGEQVFPRRYEATLTEVLEALVEREGREAVVGALEARYAAFLHRLPADLVQLPAERRLDAVTRLLQEEGFMPGWEGSAEGGTLTEHNCALRAVAERFPEICAAEERFLSAALGASVDLRAHVLDGCAACEYQVQFTPPLPIGIGRPSGGPERVPGVSA